MIRVEATRNIGLAGFHTAWDVIVFIETELRFANGNPMKLFPWQRRWILEVFREREVDYFDDRTGERWTARRRVINNSLVSIPRKNGKTGLMAAIATAFLVGPLQVRGIEIACAATKKDQAKILFNETKKMMKASPGIMEDGTFNFHVNSIFSEVHNVRFIPVASQEAGEHGHNLSVVLLDEVARMRDLKIYHTLEEAVSVQPDSMVIAFSTMDERADNPMAELIGSVEARRKFGVDDDGWHVLNCKADLKKDSDPLSKENMLRANPSAPHIPELMETLEKAREDAAISEYYLGRYKTTRLNVPGAADTQFIDPEKWASLADPAGRSMLDGLADNEPVVLGLDLSRSRDLTALAMWFPDQNFLDCVCFLPGNAIAQFEHRHRLPFREWVERDHLIACDGPVVDYGVVAPYIGRLVERFDVLKMRYDEWNFENMRDALKIANIGLPLEGVRLGRWTLDPFMNKFENMIEARTFTHSGSPILGYCVSSMAIESDPKATSPRRKPVKAYYNSLIDAGSRRCSR